MKKLEAHLQLVMRFLTLTLGALIWSGSIDVFAQSEPDTLSTKELQLSEVIITSDLFENQKKDFAGSISLIQPKIIQQANGLNLQPVLNAIPGVYMHSGALNTNRITIRGIGSRTPFSTNKIKAYLDEIPLSTGEGDTTLEDIDFATLGGIEVYRGPASTVYGAGLGGAIHMITKNTKRSNSALLDFSLGSFGLKKTNLNIDLGWEKGSVGVYYQNVTSDGYRDNNQYERQSISIIGKTRVGQKSTVTTYFNATNLKAFIPSSLDLDGYLSSPTEAAFLWANAMGFEDNNRIRIGASLKTAYNNSFESTVALFSNIGDSREVTPFGNEDITTSNFGVRGKIRKSFLEEDQLVFVLGTEVFLEDFRIASFENNNSQNGPMTSDLDQTRNYSNVFLATEFNPDDNWALTLGGNLNLSRYQNEDLFNQGVASMTGENTFDPIFSPKLSVSRKLGQDVSIYGLVAHGFSLPTFDETLNPDGDINQSIKPEVGLNYEIGLKGSLAQNKIYFELIGYTMRINDLLVARRNSELDFSGFNAGSSTHNGLELMANHQLIKSEFLTLNQSLSYTIMDYSFNDFVDDDRGDFSGNQLTGVPDRTMNYHLTMDTRLGIYGGIVWQAVGSIPILDDNSVFADSYNLFNLKLGFEKEFGSFKLNVYGGVNNLFDEKYAAMVQINPRFNQRYYYPGLPVNYFGGIKLNYRF